MSDSTAFGPMVGPADPIGDGVRAATADFTKVKQAFEQWLMRKLELEQRGQLRGQSEELGDIREILERLADRFDTDLTSGDNSPVEESADTSVGRDRAAVSESGVETTIGTVATETVSAVDAVLADSEEARAVQASREAFAASMHADEDFGADRERVDLAQGEANESEAVADDEAQDVLEAETTGDSELVAVEESEARAAEGDAERDADTATDLRTEQDGHGQKDAGKAAAATATAQSAQENAAAQRSSGKTAAPVAQHETHTAPANAWPNGSKTAQLAGGAFPHGQSFTPAQAPKQAKQGPSKTPAREKGRGMGR